MLILERPWKRQPQTVAPLRDRWRDVAVSPISGIDKNFTADRQQAVTVVGSVKSAIGSGGRSSAHTAGASVTMLRAPIPNSSIGIDGCGAAFLVRFSTTTTTSNLFIAGFGSDSGSTGNTEFAIKTALSANYVNISLGNSEAVSSFDVNNFASMRNGAAHTVLVSLENFNTSGNSTTRVFINGKLAYDGTEEIATGASNIYNWTCAGSVRRTTDLAVGATCQIYLATGFRRRVTIAEGIALTAEPWQELFAPQRIYIPTAAAAGYTHPTLSLATATEITATSFKPSVTYTFA